MGNELSWVVELAVKPGELENFRALMREMVGSTRGESGTLSYEWFVSEDGTTVDIYERYVDSAAAVTHLRTFGDKFAGRFSVLVDLTRFTVFGTPSDEAKGVLDGFGATYLGPFGGFTR